MVKKSLQLFKHPLLENILQRAQQEPKQVLIQSLTGTKYSAGDLTEISLSIAIGLTRLNFHAGNRVLLLARPKPELFLFVLAVMRLGGVLVIADPGMGKTVFKNRVAACCPQWIFTESSILFLQHHPLLTFLLKKRGYDIPELSLLNRCKVIRVGNWLPGVSQDVLFSQLLKSKTTLSVNTKKIDLHSDALIVFTSGTTSEPKAVVHSVATLQDSMKNILKILKPNQNDVFFSTLPHFLLLSIALGIPVILPDEKMSVQAVMKTIKKYSVTALFGPPSEFISLIQACQQKKQTLPQTLRLIVLGSAPVFSGFLRKLLPITSPSTKVLCMYGMTEALPIAMVDGRKKAKTDVDGDLLGTILPSIQYKIKKDGELCVSGSMMKQYLGKPASTWIETGDTVRMINNQLVLIGRKKDMIIKQNFNIYPELYESTISQIAGVSACAMVGVRSEKQEDEQIVLFVEIDSTQPNFSVTHFRQQLLSGKYSIDTHAQPDKIICMKLPRKGRQQKIDKHALRAYLKNTQL